MLTGGFMKSRVPARFALALAAAACAAPALPASAAGLPEVKTSASNPVPQCATPGRLSAFLESRNGALDSKFSTIAADYMRIGQELGIRWDTAFFQMLLETGNLKFTGDVSSSQNNFAGLGATGRKAPGESFPDVPTGVRAHLEHLMLYAGAPVANPVAERTRNIHEWGVLTSWQKSIKGPMTYSLVAKKWAPTSRRYARDIEGIADAFYTGACNQPDPKPEMMALVNPEAAKPDATKRHTSEQKVVADAGPAKISGAELARRAVEEARASGTFVRSELGASTLIPADEPAKPAVGEIAPAAAKTTAPPAVKIINAEQPAATQPAETKSAALAAGVRALAPDPDSSPKAPVCKVWTASYGGSRAIIIKASTDKQDNFTVLDVNEGAEKREAEAYIAAYAKGGEMVGEFPSPNEALDKAFELCPEG